MKPSEFLKENGDNKIPHLFEELDKRFIDKEEFNKKLEQLKRYFDDWYFSFPFSAMDNILTDTQFEHIKELKKKIEELKK